MNQTYGYTVDDGAQTMALADDGNAVVPRVVRSGKMVGSPAGVWLLVVGAVVVLGVMRRTHRGLIPGT